MRINSERGINIREWLSEVNARAEDKAKIDTLWGIK